MTSLQSTPSPLESSLGQALLGYLRLLVAIGKNRQSQDLHLPHLILTEFL